MKYYLMYFVEILGDTLVSSKNTQVKSKMSLGMFKVQIPGNDDSLMKKGLFPSEEDMQVLYGTGLGVHHRDKCHMLACNTRCTYPMETSCNSVKGQVR